MITEHVYPETAIERIEANHAERRARGKMISRASLDRLARLKADRDRLAALRTAPPMVDPPRPRETSLFMDAETPRRSSRSSFRMLAALAMLSAVGTPMRGAR